MDVKQYRYCGSQDRFEFYGVGVCCDPLIKHTGFVRSRDLPKEMTLEQYNSLPRFNEERDLFPGGMGVLHATSGGGEGMRRVICRLPGIEEDIACIQYSVKIVEK